MNAIRKHFPFLEEKFNNKPLIYFDNAATTQKPAEVLDTIQAYYKKMNANVHRSINPLGELATKFYEQARADVAKFINAPSEKEIIFTKNATEGLNLIAQTFGDKHLKIGDRVVLTVSEHHSNIVPWLQQKKKKGIIVEYIPLEKNSQKLDVKEAEKILRKKNVKILSVSYASNALGTIHPVKKLTALAKKKNVFVVIDAAASVAHLSTDVKKIGCDFLVFSGHKMYGPTGIGVVWGKKEILDSLPPFLGGGEMIEEVHKNSFTTNEVPHKFEAGTPNIAGAIGLSSAIQFISSIGFKNIVVYEQELTKYLFESLQSIPSLKRYGVDAGSSLPTAAFTLGSIHAHDVGEILGRSGIMIRSGNHCAQILHNDLKIASTARVSLSIYNTKKEIDVLKKSLLQTQKFFL